MNLSHDVLLVGGGGAGLRAAIAIAQTNPRLRIAVVSKVYPMRSHTVSAEGGAAGVFSPDDSLDEHAYDTVSGGDWLCDQDAVEGFFLRSRRKRRPHASPCGPSGGLRNTSLVTLVPWLPFCAREWALLLTIRPRLAAMRP